MFEHFKTLDVFTLYSLQVLYCEGLDIKHDVLFFFSS